MNISASHLEALQAFGYNEPEARFSTSWPSIPATSLRANSMPLPLSIGASKPPASGPNFTPTGTFTLFDFQ